MSSSKLTLEKLEAAQAKSTLPAAEKRKAFLEAYDHSQVMVLVGDTGSGKTTQIPQYVLCKELAGGKVVAVTQPRRLATTSVAARVADEMGVELGKEVGYRVRFDLKVDKNYTRLAFMTDGMLLSDLISQSGLDRYSCIIVDEAHERSLQTDTLLALLKQACRKTPSLKLVIISATLDAARFQAYFDNAPLFKITGRAFPVDINYLTKATPNFLTASLSAVQTIHAELPPGDILVFLPGEAEIENACALYRRQVKDLDVFPLYSTMPFSQQQEIFQSTKNRKCVVATNIAETSITIDGIVYVVDSGLVKEMRYNARTRQEMMKVTEVSQAAARQRAGRAGRTRPGMCFRLYTKDTHDNMMSKSSTPAILTSQLRSVILQVLYTNHDLKTLMNFDFIDKFKYESLLRGLGELKDMGFVDPKGLTKFGRKAVRLSLDPRWVYCIQQARLTNSVPSMTTIAAIFSIQKSIFLRPHSHRHVADKAREQFANGLSDHLTHLNAVCAYMRMKKEGKISPEEWCHDHFLNYHALEEVLQLRTDIGHRVVSTMQMTEREMEEGKFGLKWETQLRKALALGFYHHAAIRITGTDLYKTCHQNINGLLHPNSALVSANHEWVVYNRFSLIGKQYLDTVTAIEPEWIAEIPYFADENLPKRFNGNLVQPYIKASLDKARVSARISNLSLA